MITLINHLNKVEVISDDNNFMTSVIMKSQLNRISYNQAEDIIIMYFSNDRLIISYLFIAPAQRAALGINSNIDLFNYFNSIL